MTPEECKKMSSYQRLKIDFRFMEEEAEHWKKEHKKLIERLTELLKKIPEMDREEIYGRLAIIILDNNGTKK